MTSSIYTDLHDILLKTYNTDKTFGFFISGGFDSALLFYYSNLLKFKYKLPAQFEVFTIPRYDDSVVHSSRIIDWINAVYNTKYIISIVGNPDLHHSEQVSSGFKQAIEKCDFITLSGTLNPTHMSNLPSAPVRGPINNYKTFRPFLNYTKQQTVELAITLGIVDQLSSISHTCTESKDLRCNVCWQCKERAWGFAQNNQVDIGTM